MLVELADEEATHSIAARLADRARRGDIVALHGELGLGKTSFARGFIRRYTGYAGDIPSPTFTLVQTYAGGDCEIWHFDLYRVKDPAEIWELGFEDALAGGIVLIEWPDRLGGYLPAIRLDVTLRPAARAEARTLELAPHGGDWAARIEGIG